MAGRNYRYPSPYKSRPLLNRDAARVLGRLKGGWRMEAVGHGTPWVVSPDGAHRLKVRRRTVDLLLDGCYIRVAQGRYVPWATKPPTLSR